MEDSGLQIPILVLRLSIHISPKLSNPYIHAPKALLHSPSVGSGICQALVSMLAYIAAVYLRAKSNELKLNVFHYVNLMQAKAYCTFLLSKLVMSINKEEYHST